VGPLGKVTNGTVPFPNPQGLAFDAQGRLYISDSNTGCVYQLATNGELSLFASGLQGAGEIAVNAAGQVFVATTANGDTIYQLTEGVEPVDFWGGLGQVTGMGTLGNNSLYISVIEHGGVWGFAEDGPGNVTQLNTPSGGPIFASGIAGEGNSTLFAGDSRLGRIYEYTVGGAWTVHATNVLESAGVAVDAKGVVYAGGVSLDANLNYSSVIYKIMPNANVTIFCTLGSGEASAQVALAPAAQSAPTIVSSPASVNAAAGKSATFKVTASGKGPLQYQWQFDGTNIPGATRPTYTIRAARTANAGEYDVVVSNAGGSATSAVATLTLLTAPGIVTQPQAATVPVGTGAQFTVVASGSSLAYQWQRNSVNLKDDGNMSGSQTATLTVNSVTTKNLGLYRAVVSNAAGKATSVPVRLALATK
jgi:hypothetical protein